MSIRFCCPNCQTVLSASDDKAGHMVDCPRCGSRMQIPAAAAPPIALAISEMPDAQIDLGIDFRGGPDARHQTRSRGQKANKVGLLKFAITSAAMLWNCVILVRFTQTVTDAYGAVNRAKKLPDGYEVRLVIQNATAECGLSVLILFFVASLPVLGAFISHAKGRGNAEGYNLVTFFGPVGLIVGLCLPTNQKSERHDGSLVV